MTTEWLSTCRPRPRQIEMQSEAQLDGIIRRECPRPRHAYSALGPVKNSYRHLLPALLALITTLTPGAAAQRAPVHVARAHSAIPHFHPPTANSAFRQNPQPLGFRRSAPRTSLPFPIFGDSFNLDDLYSAGYPVASEPPASLLEAASALAGPADFPGRSAMLPPENSREPSSSTQPLMIELQNGNYVRVNRTPADGEALPLAFSPTQTQRKSARPHSTQPPEKIVIPSETRGPGFAHVAAPPPRELPPVLLVFRDGHNEEVRDYTIADGALYARGDYYTDGFWNKKIELSTLNLSKTREANAERSANFILPSSPNEVIIRP